MKSSLLSNSLFALIHRESIIIQFLQNISITRRILFNIRSLNFHIAKKEFLLQIQIYRQHQEEED